MKLKSRGQCYGGVGANGTYLIVTELCASTLSQEILDPASLLRSATQGFGRRAQGLGFRVEWESQAYHLPWDV